jgi:gamma-polyglutamate synthase
MSSPKPGLVARWKGAWLARKEADPDPYKAPHYALVRELLRAHVPPLEVRLRGELVDALAARLVTIEPSPVPLVEETRSLQIILIATRAQLAIELLEADRKQIDRQFANFNNLYSQIDRHEEQLRLMEDYLNETVSDRRKLRGDLAALKRHMNIDALRERSALQASHLEIQIELGLRFIEQGLAAAAGLTQEASVPRASGPGGPLPSTVAIEPNPEAIFATVRETSTLAFLVDRIRTADRWQTRQAAADATRTIMRITLKTARKLGHREVAMLGLTPDSISAIAKVAQNHDEHPCVQASALRALFPIDRPQAEQILHKRILRQPSGANSIVDTSSMAFIVRSRFLRAAAIDLQPENFAALFVEAVAGIDPSEHVRIQLCDLAPVVAHPHALASLRSLSGRGSHPEPSARVRAAAAIACQQIAAATFQAQPDVSEQYIALLTDILSGESDPVAHDITGQELIALATVARKLGLGAKLEAPIAIWIRLLLERAAAEKTPAALAESAAALAEALDRERNPIRQRLAAELYKHAMSVRPQRAKHIPLASFPDALQDAVRDPEMLGRTMADLSRRDWGLSVTQGDKALTLYRGDFFGRRAWRIWHEFWHRAPNKRQAWRHTVGRKPKGLLRANPGSLDEVTPTTVPGERVHIDAEGGWGRHLPRVDDLLDLPVFRNAAVQLFSSHGTTRIAPPASFFKRITNRLRISLRYRRLADLRSASLSSYEPRDRSRFLQTALDDYGIETSFVAHGYGDLPNRPPVSAAVGSLMPREPEAVPATAAAAFAPWNEVTDFFNVHGYYFLSPSENSQTALTLFMGGLATAYVFNAYRKRSALQAARDNIPLCIAGWGTRGKSGTERLKAGLFHGLGYEVFVKTTGCEAMFIHSVPGQAPMEIFIYRPYDKATIWEQSDLVHLGSRLKCNVFLWECMALNPKYVELLAHEWMRDDLSTLTNAYPDHEDIQGPAGMDVASVIASFIPYKGRLLHSELNFQPLFAEVAKARETQTTVIGEREAHLIADDMLDLFPYREHPRNIALVTRMAEEFGIDREFAMITMAEHVVPDLGVLKHYPPVRVIGRESSFINTCSANERAGCVASWRRMNLHKVDLEAEPREAIVVVVNNRADRISRSEVFARIVVRDMSADRFVLIGSNLKGLGGFIKTALQLYLSELSMLDAEDLANPEAALVRCQRRLDEQMARLRVPRPDAEAVVMRIAAWASGAHFPFHAAGVQKLREAIVQTFEEAHNDPSLTLAKALERTRSDRRIEAALVEALSGVQSEADAKIDASNPQLETLDPPTREDFAEQVKRQLARIAVRASCNGLLQSTLKSADSGGIARYTNHFNAVYTEFFDEMVMPIENFSESGDKIIRRCARSVPPGVNLRIVGCQNIKGTGLDFVYRWVAIDKIRSALNRLSHPRVDKRMAALVELESFEDHGVYDLGLIRSVLGASRGQTGAPDENAARDRILRKVEPLYQQKREALDRVAKQGKIDRFLGVCEGWLDYLDSIFRRKTARLLWDELVNQRISHGRAELQMRMLVGRQKGGWLSKMLRSRK